VPDLSIQVEEVNGHGSAALVVLTGSIDAKTVITFQSHLNSVREKGIHRFILDMEHVRYVNSTGLGYLINLSDSVHSESGEISLVKVQPKVKIVFDMLGLNQFFKIFNSREEATRRFLEEGGGPAPAAAVGAAAASISRADTAVRPHPTAAATRTVPVREARPAAEEQWQVECQTCHATLAMRENGLFKCPRCFTRLEHSGGGRVAFLPSTGWHPVQLTLNLSGECTQMLVEFVGTLSRKCGFSDAGAQELQSAVSTTVESLFRVVYGGQENHVYHVLISPQESGLEVRFSDYGAALPPASDALAKIKSAVDRFDLKPHPRGGNVILLSKKAV
jgi:anti-anti-sigma factor